MTEQMTSGIELMFTGMGIVFLFLIMLVIAINIMSALVQRYFPDIPVSKPVPGITADIDKSVVAAITAAVHQYRKKHN
ncbi:OadG family protein [Methylobacter tundripaludum]|uniref:OadG family protein n=1 Tax=Methylobacter tundripaludum TaxID=173365 RepID=UPI0004DF70DF|nr:OadG family transporter subunit [Methylobacter tundripaludum]